MFYYHLLIFFPQIVNKYPTVITIKKTKGWCKCKLNHMPGNTNKP